MKKRIFTSLFFLLSLFVSQGVDALTISPPIIEVNGDPGTRLTGTVTVYNETTDDQVFYTSFENFEPGEDSGVPHFIGNQDGLATWLAAESEIFLKAGERKEVPFSVTIPVEVDPGGYFSAVFFGDQPPVQTPGTVAIGGRLGVLVLLRVNGDIPEDAGLVEFGTRDGKFFYDTLPVNFEYRFSNKGGDRVVPRGEIEITNTFGSKRGLLDANTVGGNVLPDSVRRFSTSWLISDSEMFELLTKKDLTEDERDLLPGFFDKVSAQWKNFAIGWYTADLYLGWGTDGQVARDSVSFLIVPWQLLIVLFVLVTLVRVVIRFFLKWYKKRLLQQIREQNID